MTIRFCRAKLGYAWAMAMCCPPGHGCNAPGGEEPCALALCRAAAAEDDAKLALARWGDLEAVAAQNCGDGERRFRRRAFERARDRALIALAMTSGRLMARGGQSATGLGGKNPRRSRSRQSRRLAARGV